MLQRSFCAQAAQNEIERARPTMSRVGVAHCSDAICMTAVRQPAFHFPPDRSTWSLIGPAHLAGDEEDDTDALPHRSVQRARKSPVRAHKMMAVQIDGHVDGNPPCPQIPIPAAVQRSLDGSTRGHDRSNLLRLG